MRSVLVLNSYPDLSTPPGSASETARFVLLYTGGKRPSYGVCIMIHQPYWRRLPPFSMAREALEEKGKLIDTIEIIRNLGDNHNL